jgi:hypothetical protein
LKKINARLCECFDSFWETPALVSKFFSHATKWGYPPGMTRKLKIIIGSRLYVW